MTQDSSSSKSVEPRDGFYADQLNEVIEAQSPALSELKQKLEKLDNQRGAKEALAVGTYDETPPTDDDAVVKKLYKIKDWYLAEVEALIAAETTKARIDELERLSTYRHYGKDYQDSMDELAQYKEDRIKELKKLESV